MSISAAPTSSATTHGTFLVLEDNARTPSGVSYVIENRHMMLRAFPDLLDEIGLRPIDDYGLKLVAALREIAPARPQRSARRAAVARAPTTRPISSTSSSPARWACRWSKAATSWFEDDRVYMRTIGGLARVDVIYRRIDDDFLDPEAFRPDSMLGVPGLMRAYQAGNVALANAVGTGVADDKAVYAYMPRMIRYYLGQDPILPNVETHICREPEALQLYAGSPRRAGRQAGRRGGRLRHHDRARAPAGRNSRTAAPSLLADPANYISQPCIRPVGRADPGRRKVEPRHVDLRPFAITGAQHLGAAGRAHARGAAQGLAGGQLVAGRRLEGHVGLA